MTAMTNAQGAFNIDMLHVGPTWGRGPLRVSLPMVTLFAPKEEDADEDDQVDDVHALLAEVEQGIDVDALIAEARWQEIGILDGDTDDHVAIAAANAGL